MKIPNLPFGQKKEPSEYYLALTLRDDKASAVIFEENLKRATVVGFGEANFTAGIETASDKEFLEVLDKAISQAEKNLPNNIETQKTIFAVKDGWVMDGKIKPDYLAKLKKASEELDLKPVGFLVITEAIVNLLEKEEGAPPTVIITELGLKQITVTLVRAGRIIEVKPTAL